MSEKMSMSDYIKLSEERNTQLILDSIKMGKSPLLQSWESKNIYNDLALNPQGQNVYQGSNVLMLDTKRALKGFKTNQWLTFKQASELGASVKKGEKSINVVFFQKGKTDEEIQKMMKDNPLDPEKINTLRRNMMKYYSVFNVEQIDFKDTKIPGFIPEYKPKKVDLKELEAISKNYNQEGMSAEFKVLRNQIAKYIAAKDFQDNYEITNDQREILQNSVKNLEFSEIKQAITDGSKMSFELSKKSYKTTQQSSETQKKERAMDYLRENKPLEIEESNQTNCNLGYQQAINQMFNANSRRHQ